MHSTTMLPAMEESKQQPVVGFLALYLVSRGALSMSKSLNQCISCSKERKNEQHESALTVSHCL
jgi:hypothetical protein